MLESNAVNWGSISLYRKSLCNNTAYKVVFIPVVSSEGSQGYRGCTIYSGCDVSNALVMTLM